MIKLWLKENDIPALTSFAGNIDADKIKPFIFIAQTDDIKPILGFDLYNKINADYIANSLTDVYLTIYTDYIQKMLVYFACAHYIAMNTSMVTNIGTLKADGSTDLREADRLSNRYKALATNVQVNFQEYMKTISIPEYNKDKVQRKTNIISWH